MSRIACRCGYVLVVEDAGMGQPAACPNCGAPLVADDERGPERGPEPAVPLQGTARLTHTVPVPPGRPAHEGPGPEPSGQGPRKPVGGTGRPRPWPIVAAAVVVVVAAVLLVLRPWERPPAGEKKEVKGTAWRTEELPSPPPEKVPAQSAKEPSTLAPPPKKPPAQPAKEPSTLAPPPKKPPAQPAKEPPTPAPPPTKIPAQPDVPEAPKADPDAAETAFRRGETAFENGRYGEAVEAYGEAIRLNPKHGPAHTRRGRAYLLTGKYPEAIADYDQAISLDPKSLVFKYRNRAEAHWNSGNREAAAADFRKVIELCEQECERDPKAAGPANRLAWTLATLPVSELRDGRRAVQLATAACQQADFKSYEYLGTLAAASAEAGDFPAAIKWSQQAIDRAPEARRPALTMELEAYRAGKPWRDPPER